MVKARSLYYFRGTNTISLCRGYPLEKKETLDGIKYDWKMKHRGFFTKFISVENISDIFISKPFKVFVDDRILDGWELYEINFDIETKKPFMASVPPSISAQLASLSTQLEYWKRRCSLSENKLKTLENKDRFDEAMKKELLKVQDARNKVLGISSGYGGIDMPFGFGGYGSRYMPPMVNTTDE